MGRRGWRRGRGRRALVVDAVRESLHHWLRSWRVGGRDRRFESRKRSRGGGAGAGEVGRRGRGRGRRRRGRRSALRAELRERSRSGWGRLGGRALSLTGEQRPLAAVGRTLRLHLGRVEVGGGGVVDRRGGQRRGVQLGGGQRGGLGSQRLAAGGGPGLDVAVLVLGRPTGRTGRARLQRRDRITHLSKGAGAQTPGDWTHRVGGGLLNARRRTVPQGGRVSTLRLRVYRRKKSKLINRKQEIQ